MPVFPPGILTAGANELTAPANWAPRRIDCRDGWSLDGAVGHISTVFVHKVVEAFGAERSDREAMCYSLFQSVGVDPKAPIDPKAMIRDNEFFDLLERITSEDEIGRSVPVRVGASMRCDDYGAFGLAFKSALDLWGSFQRVERYGRIVTSIANFRVERGSDTSFIEVIPARENRPGLEMTNELAVSAATALSREVCQQEFVPTAVFFSHEEPGEVTFDDYFGCPVNYRADRDGLEISNALLRSPNRLGDTGISSYFDTQLEVELAELPHESDLQSQVCIQIAQSLSEGVPTLQDVALGMGMSGRTLQRRLSEQELSFKTLVDESRRQLAERLLEQTQYSLSEIAFLAGFSEQSAFNRAFKRWAGTTPRSYRLGVRPDTN